MTSSARANALMKSCALPGMPRACSLQCGFWGGQMLGVERRNHSQIMRVHLARDAAGVLPAWQRTKSYL